MVTQTFSGSSHQPTIKITSSDTPYRSDPRFPGAANERHGRASDRNRYSVALHKGSLFYINFWAGEVDSILARVAKTRISDRYTFNASVNLCTFQPLPLPGGSELFLYCGFPDAGEKSGKYKSRCTFEK